MPPTCSVAWTSRSVATSRHIWPGARPARSGRRASGAAAAARPGRADALDIEPPPGDACCPHCSTRSRRQRTRRSWRTAAIGFARASYWPCPSPAAPSGTRMPIDRRRSPCTRPAPIRGRPATVKLTRFRPSPRLKLTAATRRRHSYPPMSRSWATGCTSTTGATCCRPRLVVAVPGEDVEIVRTSPWPARRSAGSRSPMTPASRCCGSICRRPGRCPAGGVTPGGPRRPGCRGSCVPGSRSRRCRSPTAVPASGSARTPPGWGTPPSDTTHLVHDEREDPVVVRRVTRTWSPTRSSRSRKNTAGPDTEST